MKRRKVHSLSQISNNNAITNNRAGTINYMVLKNFMCHSFLEVKFPSNIVIITGRNGSGKSAIITALALIFAGKATVTNRGRNVSGFVKAGQTTAKIEIDLYNGGIEAYQPQVYGERINITRTISIKGQSSYRIVSEHGELVSTEAREVKCIADFLNIQINNPACVLNQDTSRNFLHTSKPENRFKLFMKATQLDVLDMEIKRAQSNSESCLRTIAEKQEDLARIHRNMVQLQEKIRNYNTLTSLKNQKSLLQRELIWTKVRDIELELEEEVGFLEKFEKKLEEMKKNAHSVKEKFQALKLKESDLMTQLSEIKQQIETQKRPEQKLKSQINDLSRQAAQNKGEVKAREAGIQQQKAEIADLKDQIANLSKNRSEAEDRRKKKKEKCLALQEKLKDIEDRLGTARNESFQANCDLSRKEEKIQDLRDKLRWSDGKLRSDMNSLSELDRTSDNLAVYGTDMRRVKQMIEQYKSKFRHVPKGPLGCYIKIKDKKWTLPAEQHLGVGNLKSFVVDNADDNRLLRQIFNQVWNSGRQPPTIITKYIFKKFSGLKHVMEPEGCVSLYNILEIEDPVVSNCIVDISRPQSILLVPNDDVAMSLLSDARRVPMHCKQAITINGDIYYPDPNYKSYCAQLKTPRFLQADSSSYKRQLQQNIENLKKDMEDIKRQLTTLDQEKRSQERRKVELEDKIRNLTATKHQILRQLQDVNMDDSLEPAATDPAFLEKLLTESKDLLLKKKSDMERIIDNIKVTEAQIAENEQTLSQLRDSNKGLDGRVHSLQEEFEEIKFQLQKISHSEDFDRKEIKEYEIRIAEAQFRIETAKKKKEEMKLKAVSVGERVPTLRQLAQVQDEMTALLYKITSIEADSQDVNETNKKLEEVSEKYEKSSEIVTSLNNAVDKLSNATEMRSSTYKNTENYFISYIRYAFVKFLKRRQFQGSIEIDVEGKTLDLVVTPQHGSQGSTSTSNLSGGERSFTTVAFLYSLWQCFEFPFYFLDEFDVYMDKLNRTTVIEILLHHARSKPGLQFVFFTPQDISLFSENNEDVSVLRLEDPERTAA